ncbi:MAG: arginase family protein [bacterium]
MSHSPWPRLFGAALDYLDDPRRLGLKLAYLEAQAKGNLSPELPRDPYDALAPLIKARLKGRATLAGKLEVPGRFTPRPPPEDSPHINQRDCREFMDAGGPYLTARSCGKQALAALPEVPLMIGVDHGLCAGPIAALASRHGKESLAVVVLDSHFDAIAPEERSGDAEAARCGRGLCGDFLGELLKQEEISPELLFVAGVGDKPAKPSHTGEFGRAYHDWIEKGVKVYTRAEAQNPGFPERLVRDFMRCGACSLYVSLDADVGSCASMNAVRFLADSGLDEHALLSIGYELGRLVASGRMELAGADVCEIDVHLLGLPDRHGQPDRTADICARFISTLFGDEAFRQGVKL